jgi:hypothetical protein
VTLVVMILYIAFFLHFTLAHCSTHLHCCCKLNAISRHVQCWHSEDSACAAGLPYATMTEVRL